MTSAKHDAPGIQHLSQTFQGKKVFVTGHTGFKGAWLCEWLLSLGAQVSGFSLPGEVSSPSLFGQLDLTARMDDRRGDIRDGALVTRTLLDVSPDFVFHLAAQPLVRLSYRTPVETWETNVLGTIHVLEALRALQGVKVASLSLRGDPAAQGVKVESLSGASTSHLNLNTEANASVPLNTATTVAVMITTDKVYENREWLHGYREVDPLGGHDPYSSSKAAAELAIASWRNSYFRHQVEVASLSSSNTSTSHLNLNTKAGASVPLNTRAFARVLIASARAGNVIGGGDWAEDRIVPDAIRALREGRPVPVRNKISTRPWQHVLEPLSGYLLLAARMSASVEVASLRGDPAGRDVEVESLSLSGASTSHLNLNTEAPASVRLNTEANASVPLNTPEHLASAFNFGPHLESNKTVKDLVEEILKHWPGTWEDRSDPHAPHEAGKLNLVTDKAHHLLGWSPRWDFATTLQKTVAWYRGVHEGTDPAALTRQQIAEYHSHS